MAGTLHRDVWRRAHARCEYCQMPQRYDPLPFQLDHVVARVHGGPTESDNLALACVACNRHKGPNLAGRDPGTGRIVTLFHPRREVWTRHFVWRGALLAGRTPRGRATIEVLGINLPHRVALRATLIEEGGFPPSEE